MLRNVIGQIIKEKYFSISIDESTDVSVSKNLVMMARFVEEDPSFGIAIRIKMLDLIPLEKGDAATITDAILKYFEDHALDIQYLVGFSSDGASVMTGKHNGVAAKLKALNCKIVDTHCAAHRLQLAVKDACSDFMNFYVGIVKQTAAYFDKSSLRKDALKIWISIF